MMWRIRAVSYTHLEFVVSAYEKQSFLDSVAICGNTVVGYTSREKTDTAFVEKHIQDILRQNGFYVSVKIFRKLGDYTKRLETMWEHRDGLLYTSLIPYELAVKDLVMKFKLLKKRCV